MKQEKHRRIHEVKVRFSDAELALAKSVEEKYGICRAETLRNLYMTRIYTLICSSSEKNTEHAA